MDILGTVMIFGITMTILLIGYSPIYQMNHDHFAVRLRRRPKIVEARSMRPTESVILILMRLVGDRVIATFPLVANERIRQLLMHANLRSANHLAIFAGVKSTCVLVLGLMILLSGMDIAVKVMALLGASFVSWTMPDFFVAGAAKKRRFQILNELPCTIDLLIVCAQAGSGLLMCIDKVQKETRDSCPNLSAELEQLMQDVKIFAKPVSFALKDMGERCGVEDITSMASALISAETKGSDISYPLRQQATALRDKLKRRKEEDASKIPVKMVPVIMVFVMPLILCPLLGPAVIIILSALFPTLPKS